MFYVYMNKKINNARFQYSHKIETKPWTKHRTLQEHSWVKSKVFCLLCGMLKYVFCSYVYIEIYCLCIPSPVHIHNGVVVFLFRFVSFF